MFSRLKISAKLLILIGALMACMLGVGGYALRIFDSAQERGLQALERKSRLTDAVDAVRQAEVRFTEQVLEFKNLLLRAHEPGEYDRQLALFRKEGEHVAADLQNARKLMVELGVPLQQLDEARQLHADMVRQLEQSLQGFAMERAESTLEVDHMVRGKDRPLHDKIEAVVAVVQDYADAESGRIVEATAAESRRIVTVLGAVIALVLAAGSVFGVWVARGITRPLQEAVLASQRVAQGDLTVSLQVRTRDEIGQLLQAMSEMTGNLRGVVGEVVAGAHAVADSSAQIAQGNLDLSQRTEEQASTLEETASQMEELTSTVTQNADNARQASQVAAGAAEVARKGGAVVADVVQTMSGISESSKQIADIISVIDGIAFQTNILALNAAVEAARAGDQGRGFAVVAAEVRNLAQRSAGAAKEIKTLIVDSVQKVGDGSRLVDVAGRTMQEIVASVKQVSDLIAEIAAASNEQSAGIEQVNTAVTQMDQVVQQNASLVEEATAATESMKGQAHSLLQVVSRFRLGDGQATPVVPQARRGAPLQGVERAQQPPLLQPAFSAVLGGGGAGLSANGDWREF